MEITSKSLYYSNIVFVFKEGGVPSPDNAVINSLFDSKLTVGAHFIDDPVLQTRILDLPQIKLQVALSPNRLRIEDLSQEEPKESPLIGYALDAYRKLYVHPLLSGFGFNFDIYYRFSEVIRIQDMFSKIADNKILLENDLRDMGIQFTIDKKGVKQETYFIKITAPLEIIVHVNHHFPAQDLPDKNSLQKLYERCYDETDEVIKNLSF